MYVIFMSGAGDPHANVTIARSEQLQPGQRLGRIFQVQLEGRGRFHPLVRMYALIGLSSSLIVLATGKRDSRGLSLLSVCGDTEGLITGTRDLQCCGTERIVSQSRAEGLPQPNHCSPDA